MTTPTWSSKLQYTCPSTWQIISWRSSGRSALTVVVWGQRFRNYLLEYCLPSLLAPGNIPSLAGQRPAKFIFTTTAEDWQAIQATAIFQTLKRYATPVFLELPQCPPDRPNWAHAVVGFKLYCDAVYREKAYRIFTTPDLIIPMEATARLHQLACEGVQAVFVNIPPIAEESFFERLGKMGLSPSITARDTGIPLVYSSRQLVSAALNSLHSMTVVNEWAAPYFCGYAAIPWWRVPGEEEIVLFGMSRDPILIDYSAVGQHDVSII